MSRLGSSGASVATAGIDGKSTMAERGKSGVAKAGIDGRPSMSDRGNSGVAKAGIGGSKSMRERGQTGKNRSRNNKDDPEMSLLPTLIEKIMKNGTLQYKVNTNNHGKISRKFFKLADKKGALKHRNAGNPHLANDDNNEWLNTTF